MRKRSSRLQKGVDIECVVRCYGAHCGRLVQAVAHVRSSNQQCGEAVGLISAVEPAAAAVNEKPQKRPIFLMVALAQRSPEARFGASSPQRTCESGPQENSGHVAFRTAIGP